MRLDQNRYTGAKGARSKASFNGHHNPEVSSILLPSRLPSYRDIQYRMDNNALSWMEE